MTSPPIPHNTNSNANDNTPLTWLTKLENSLLLLQSDWSSAQLPLPSSSIITTLAQTAMQSHTLTTHFYRFARENCWEQNLSGPIETETFVLAKKILELSYRVRDFLKEVREGGCAGIGVLLGEEFWREVEGWAEELGEPFWEGDGRVYGHDYVEEDGEDDGGWGQGEEDGEGGGGSAAFGEWRDTEEREVGFGQEERLVIRQGKGEGKGKEKVL